METDELVKIVNLQKSSYSNLFYINYGFDIKNIDEEDLTIHIYIGLGSKSDSENKYIKDLLNLESNIREIERMNGIKDKINQIIIPLFRKVKNENDLKECLIIKKIDILLPEVVMKYFGLSYT